MTGSLYVMHQASVEGKSVGRLTKFSSYDSLREEFHADIGDANALAIDAWTAETRLEANRNHASIGRGRSVRKAGHENATGVPFGAFPPSRDYHARLSESPLASVPPALCSLST
jgi:hypothetical protein